MSEEENLQDEQQAAEQIVEELTESIEEASAEVELSVEAQIVTLTEQLAAAKDQAMRVQAEAQNTRRRAEQDVDKARKYAVEKIVGDLLPVVDNLERALATLDRDDASQKAIVEGLDLTHKSFVDNLTKHNVEQINPAGEPFDPQLHQAMTMVPNPDLEPNTVMDVFQMGYSLNGRLVRPAMVVVSKAP